MLQALMDGQALTATELACTASVTPQTASGHLAQLTAAGLLSVSRQGRHRYHRLAGPQVARLLESLTLVASGSATPRVRTGPRDELLRRARTCYDHIAGRLGVALADSFKARGWVEIDDDAALVTPLGLECLSALGIALTSAAPCRARSAPLCRPCLDWSERRSHLAGRLGRALCGHGLAHGWIRRRQGSRALDITPEGRRLYREVLGVDDLGFAP